MAKGEDLGKLLAQVDFSDERSLVRYAEHLEGMTFQDVLDLGIYSPKLVSQHEAASARAKSFTRSSYKGGAGNLIEERFFAYDANSDERPDFPDAGVELKTTCYDVKKNGEPSAGERLSITMIPFDREVCAEFDSSHLWAKSRRILLIYYHRDKSVPFLDRRIEYVLLFTPPEKDLAIIRDDFETIVRYVREGRADELSEGLTTYLGAATKGSTEATMWVEQFYPRAEADGTSERRPAKRRVFALKRQYMDYVLKNYVIPARSRARRSPQLRWSRAARGSQRELEERTNDSILSVPLKRGETFEGRIQTLVERYVGMSDRELCDLFGLAYNPRNKAMWTSINRRILGVTGRSVEEFEKANIRMRTVRVEEDGRIVQSVPLPPFEFLDLAAERDWCDSELYRYLEEQRFFFTVFRMREGSYRLLGARLWNMPERDIDGAARACWESARDCVVRGVRLTKATSARGGVTYGNDFPGIGDNPVMHVRPHATHRAYLLEDGTRVGNVEKDANPLPDGRWMTTQSFWINASYLAPILSRLP